MKKILVLSLVGMLFLLTSCAGMQKQPFTTASLEGKWVGEWTYETPSGWDDTGKLEITLKRLNATTWNIDISAPKSGMPGGRVSANLNEESPIKLVGEQMGVAVELQLREVGEDRIIQAEVSFPRLGEGTAESRCIGNIIRGTYTDTIMKGKGQFTIEKQKQ